jgi:hypothetical protein
VPRSRKSQKIAATKTVSRQSLTLAQDWRRMASAQPAPPQLTHPRGFRSTAWIPHPRCSGFRVAHERRAGFPPMAIIFVFRPCAARDRRGAERCPGGGAGVGSGPGWRRRGRAHRLQSAPAGGLGTPLARTHTTSTMGHLIMVCADISYVTCVLAGVLSDYGARSVGEVGGSGQCYWRRVGGEMAAATRGWIARQAMGQRDGPAAWRTGGPPTSRRTRTGR